MPRIDDPTRPSVRSAPSTPSTPPDTSGTSADPPARAPLPPALSTFEPAPADGPGPRIRTSFAAASVDPTAVADQLRAASEQLAAMERAMVDAENGIDLSKYMHRRPDGTMEISGNPILTLRIKKEQVHNLGTFL